MVVNRVIKAVKKHSVPGLVKLGLRKAQNLPVTQLKKFPPEVDQNKLVFYALENFSDNPRALYEYLIDNGYDKKYSIVWLVDDAPKYARYERPNVRFVTLKNRLLGVYTYEARKEVLSAGKIFYSHSMNWTTPVRMDQVFIDLWHGCGYKGQKIGIKRKVFFDYCLVPGEFFIPVKAEFFSTQKRKILPIGYPRYDWFKTEKTQAKLYAEQLKSSHGARKLVMWMPTFRQTNSATLGQGEMVGEIDLPITSTVELLKRVDECCAKNDVVMLLKRHILQLDYDIAELGLKNIVPVDSDDLAEQNVNLYELLAATDALVSDYSSVAIDYLLVDKPIAFILDDYETLEYERGWSFEDPLDYMPGHHVYDIDQFEGFIECVAEGGDPHRDERAAVRKELHNECDGYCKRIVEYFGM